MIELIYDASCPNVPEARKRIIEALIRADRPIRWREWRRDDPASPAHVRNFGSPTVLVDGQDVVGRSPTDERACCRLYRQSNGSLQGAPSVADIAERLKRSTAKSSSSSWWTSVTGVSGVTVALLPKLACPACWPAYAALLSAVGLGFLLQSRYLLIVTSAFLCVALAALAFRANCRHGYHPFILGLIGSILILAGKWAWGLTVVVYTGASLMLIATVWNAWPTRSSNGSPCCGEVKQCAFTEEDDR